MKQNSNQIDEHFHQRLYGAEVTPPAFVWVNLENELRKRRRKIVFFWLVALVIGGAGLWGVWNWHYNNSRQPETASNIPGPALAVDKTGESPGSRRAAQAENILPESAQLPKDNSPAAGEKGIPAAAVVKKSLESPVSLPGSPVETPAAENPRPAALVDNRTGSDESPVAGPSPAMAGPPLLGNAPVEPLVFNRKNEWPKAKPFIRKKKDPHFCYDFSQHPTVWMADAYGGPSFAARALESNGPAYEPYRKQRQDTETKDFSFNAGMRGSLLFGRHFLLRSGLHYEQMTEVFEYADPDYIKYLVEITQTTVDGKPVTIIDTVGVEYGENYTKTYNRYGMLDVPVAAGLELRSGRFGLSLNGGLSLNVLFWKRGSILSTGGKPQPFTPGEKGAVEVFRPRTGVSVEGSAQIFFHLQPRLRIFAEPYFRQVLKPVTLDDQPVDQRYRISGIKFGLTRILN